MSGLIRRTKTTLRRDERGFTFPELLVAMMILAIAIIPMVGMFDMGLRVSTQGGHYDQARALANERLEIVRALPYNKPATAAPDSAVEIYRPGIPVTGTSGIFSWTVSTGYWREVVGVPAADNSDNSVVKPMMQVRVTVSWQGGSKTYTTTGFAAAGTR